jgi:predicted membrane protein
MIKSKSKSQLFSIDNIIGVLLAILIIFDLKIERPIINLMNTPIGIIFSLIFIIILFICLNPIIGILFLIYLFINVKEARRSTRNNVLHHLNPPREMQVEEEVILVNAPIKNQNKGNNVAFQPIVEKLHP